MTDAMRENPSQPLRVRLRGLVKGGDPPRGWDPLEPMLVAVAVLLLLVAAVPSWWGFQGQSTDPTFQVTTTRGVDFGPWFASNWTFFLLPGGWHLNADSGTWWEFADEYPEYSPYAFPSSVLALLWSLSLVLLVYAILMRWRPRSRMRGWPTAAQIGGLVCVVLAVVISTVGFVATDDVAGRLGVATAGELSVGPYLGWYAALASVLLLAPAATIALRIDRRTRGVCWRCHRDVPGAKCPFCDAVQ